MTQVDYLIEKTVPTLGSIRKYYIQPGNRWVDLDSVIVANTHQGVVFADDDDVVDKDLVKDKLGIQMIIELTFCDGISVSTIYDDTMKNRFPIRVNEPIKTKSNEVVDFYGEMYLNNKDYCRNPYTDNNRKKKEMVN